MELPVVIRPTANHRYTAQVVGVPELTVEADSEQTALTDLMHLYRQWLGEGKVVSLQVNHPWEAFMGWAKDDPLHEMYLEELQKARREADEREGGTSGWRE